MSNIQLLDRELYKQWTRQDVDGKWWWRDEVCDEYGPHDTQAQAVDKLMEYCVYLDTGMGVRVENGVIVD